MSGGGALGFVAVVEEVAGWSWLAELVSGAAPADESLVAVALTSMGGVPPIDCASFTTSWVICSAITSRETVSAEDAPSELESLSADAVACAGEVVWPQALEPSAGRPGLHARAVGERSIYTYGQALVVATDDKYALPRDVDCLAMEQARAGVELPSEKRRGVE